MRPLVQLSLTSLSSHCLLRCAGSNTKVSKKHFSAVRADSVVSSRKYGQPTEWTHPHILGKDEVNRGIQRSEFQQRREHLVEKLLKQKSGDHLLIIPAAKKQFMVEKIPYFFR